jgi:hypothetical protein
MSHIANVLEELKSKEVQFLRKELDSAVQLTTDIIENQSVNYQIVAGYYQLAVSNVEQKKKRLKVLENQKVYSLTHIKKVCMRYGMKFVPLQLYPHPIPADCLISINNYSSIGSKKLMIICPYEHLTGGKVWLDPVIVAKEEDGYKYVTHFGQDFTLMRPIVFFFQKNMIDCLFFLTLIAVFTLFYFLFSLDFLMSVLAITILSFPCYFLTITLIKMFRKFGFDVEEEYRWDCV